MLPPALLVLLIVSGVAAVQAAIRVPVVRMRRRRAHELKATLKAEIAASADEQLLRGPTRARLRRGHTEVIGVLALTTERLLFANKRLELPLADITAIKSDAWFNGSYRGGREWLIVSSERSGELGLLALEGESGWAEATRAAAARRQK